MIQWLLLLSADPAFNMRSCGIENRQLIKELGKGDSWIPYGSSQCHTHPQLFEDYTVDYTISAVIAEFSDETVTRTGRRRRTGQ